MTIPAEHLFPIAEIAADQYDAQFQTCLTRKSTFGKNTFQSDQDIELCQREFNAEYSDIEFLLNRAVNRDCVPFQSAVVRLIELVKSHSN